MRAWFQGEFDRCLELCDAVRPADPAGVTHVMLLRARALLRLQRPNDALDTLRRTPRAPYGSDEFVTTCMLTGEAHVRRGEPSEGLALLVDAQRSAEAGNVHRTIRSEIAMNVGLARYCLHQFNEADAVLRLVKADADLVYARAVQFRAWVASAQGDGARAITLFIRALRTLDRCSHVDRYFEANCVRALAHLALERLDSKTWSFVSARRDRVDWSSMALAHPGFAVAYCAAAYALDVEGDPVKAAREGRIAERLAPSDAYRVQARCRRAWIARHTGQVLAHRDHAESAAELFQTIDSRALDGDEKIVPLVLAEELSEVEPDAAATLVELYETLSPMSPLHIMTRSSMGRYYRELVHALLLHATGRREAAAERYRDVFEGYRRIGYVRRALMIADRLWRLTGDRKMYAYMLNATKGLPKHSGLVQHVRRATDAGLRLTAVQREVLVLICEGKSNPEIARLRKRSLHTVRNLVARLFEIFEVTSREQLAVECVRRGLYATNGS